MGLPKLGASARRMLRGMTVWKTLIFEELPKVLLYLAGQIGSIVVHGQQNTLDFDLGSEGLADAIERVQKLGDAFESEEFALHGDQNGIGGDHSI